MTHDEFDRCMKVLAAGVGRPMEKMQAVVWRESLEGLEFDRLKRGITDSLRDWTFGGFPPLGFVAERCGIPKAAVAEDHHGVIAWATVLNAIGTYGGYLSVEWDDRAIPAAIEAVAGSWPALCEMESSELIRYIKPKFIEAWKAFRCAGFDRRSVSLGILARDAGRIGSSEPSPVRIGESVPSTIGFGGGQAKSLPAPESPLGITLAHSLSGQWNLPPNEGEERGLPERQPVKQKASLPTPEETRARFESQRLALEVKYGPLRSSNNSVPPNGCVDS